MIFALQTREDIVSTYIMFIWLMNHGKVIVFGIFVSIIYKLHLKKKCLYCYKFF